MQSMINTFIWRYKKLRIKAEILALRHPNVTIIAVHTGDFFSGWVEKGFARFVNLRQEDQWISITSLASQLEVTNRRFQLRQVFNLLRKN